MAVAFDAAGPSSAGTGGSSPVTWAHTNSAAGNAIVVGITDFGGAAGTVTAVTYGAASLAKLGYVPANNSNAGGVELWGAIGGLPTGSNTVTVTSTGDSANHNCGSITFTGAGSFGTPQTSFGDSATPTSASFATTSGGIVFATACDGTQAAFTASGGSTIAWSHQGTGNSGSDNGGAAYKASTGGSMTVAMAAGFDFWGVVAVEILPAGAGAPAPQSARTLYAPGWHPGRNLPGLPAGTPFALPQRPAPPGPVTTAITGEADAASSAAGVVTQVVTGQATAAGTASGATGRYITGIGGSGASSYFTDNTGAPRPMIGDTPWGLLVSAGRYSSGAWQSDIDTYLSHRAGQGYTAIELDLMADTTITAPTAFSGQTWDGIFPFPGGSAPGNPSSGLTSTYWARFDYLLNSALAKGITVFANVGITYDIGSPGCLSGLTNTQLHDYGFSLATRYLSQPNIIWRIEDDYFGGDDSKLDQILAGIRAAGDTRPVSCQNYSESTSRKDLSNGTTLTWGNTNSTYQWVYSYNVSYFGVEEAYKETSPILVLRGDGYYYKNSGDDQLIRNHFWWSLASGSRGFNGGDDNVWQFGSGSITATADANAGQFHTSVVKNGAALLASLPNWHKLLPDTSNTFITAGRGTRATSLSSGGGGGAYGGTTDAYVAASLTAAGDLALIYATHHGSFTIDQTKLVAGYTATWVDPVTCATTSATPGSSYDSTSLGSNSAGNPDWVLVLQAPAAVTVQGTASATAAATAAATVTEITLGEGDAAGTAAGAVRVSVIAAAAAAATGAGVVVQGVTATASAAGTGTGLVTQVTTGEADAASTAAGSVTQGNTGSGAGTGTATGLATLPATATAAAAGTAAGTGTAVTPGTATATAAGTAGGPVIQTVTGEGDALASAAALVTQRAAATAAGLGTATGTGTVAGSGEADAVAAVAGLVRQVVTAGADGQGTATGAGGAAGTATAAGAGAAAGLVTEGTTAAAMATSTGIGLVTGQAPGEADGAATAGGLVVQVVTASATGAGTAAGSGTSTSGQHGEGDGVSTAAAVAVQGNTAQAAAAGTATGAVTLPSAGVAAGTASAAGLATQGVTVSAAAASTAAGGSSAGIPGAGEAVASATAAGAVAQSSPGTAAALSAAAGLAATGATAVAQGSASASGLAVLAVTATAGATSGASGLITLPSATATAAAASGAVGLVTLTVTATAAGSAGAAGASAGTIAGTATAAASASVAEVFTLTAAVLAAALASATGTPKTSSPAAVLSGTATVAGLSGTASVPGPGGSATASDFEGAASIG